MGIDIADTIRATGLRVTAPRQAVLEALVSGPPPATTAGAATLPITHPDVEQITAAARTRLGSVSRQAVYDVLSAFEDADLVRRVSLGGSAARYEIDRHDNHHHLVCRGCGAVTDVACATGESPCVVPADTHGFAVEKTDIIFWALCPDCQAECQKEEARQGAGRPEVNA